MAGGEDDIVDVGQISLLTAHLVSTVRVVGELFTHVESILASIFAAARAAQSRASSGVKSRCDVVAGAN